MSRRLASRFVTTTPVDATDRAVEPMTPTPPTPPPSPTPERPRLQPIFDQSKDTGHASFYCARRFGERFEFQWHYHEEYELTLIESGSGRRFVGNNIAGYEPGDLVLIGPNLPHTWHAAAAPGVEHTAVCVQFLHDFLGESLWTRAELRPINKTLRLADNGVHFSNLAVRAVRDDLEALPGLNGFDRLVRFLCVLYTLATVDEPATLATPDYKPTIESMAIDRIDTVCGHIQRNLKNDIHQPEVAAMIGMSPSSFSRFFKKSTGKSFVDYINEVRINEACRLLVDTDMPVADVCFEVGFSSLSNFNRWFSRITNVTPREYRTVYCLDQRRPQQR